jgi:hypothetical protein
MRFTITIEDRLGQDIKSFCKANGLSITEYVLPIIENQFNIDRYGDMNEMIASKVNAENKVAKKFVFGFFNHSNTSFWEIITHNPAP